MRNLALLCPLLVVLAGCGLREAASKVAAPQGDSDVWIGGTDGYYHGEDCPDLSEHNQEHVSLSVAVNAGYKRCPRCKGKPMPRPEVVVAPERIPADSAEAPAEGPPSTLVRGGDFAR
jgi:hypothetical protein